MGKFIEKRGAIEASTTYCDNRLVACDTTFTLPEITFATAEIQAMGTASLPLLGLLEDMETSITKVGIDKNMALLSTPGVHNIEHRWVQDVVQSDGSVRHEGCKVFLRVLPKTLAPGAGIEIGSASENDLTYAVTRMKLVISGVETLLVDRFAHILRVNGKDYYNKFNKYL